MHKDIKAHMFHGSYHPALRSTLEHAPYPEWFKFLIHLPSLMHLHGETISVKEKKICLLSKVEKWTRVRLYRNFARHSIRKVEENRPPFFLSFPRSIKLPLRGGKQQTRLFFLPWGESTSHWGYHWKVKPLQISWKLHSGYTLPAPYWAPSNYHLCYNNTSRTRRGDMSSRGVENVRTTLWPFDCREYRWASNTLLMSEMQPVSFAFTVPFRSVTALCVSFLKTPNFSI